MAEKPSVEHRETDPQPSVITAPPAQIPPSQPPPAYDNPVEVIQPVSAAAKGEQYQQELLARCAAGQHDYSTRFGPCGIITAIVSACDFPRV
ncbi:uncharacterized protein LACBIDRAFT_306056 [Laccaria bicolor S238N-H82]|uniref:Predicted protein n=1 Tax=Laccaria bicolor (strain S238N-H82 / ATCC MYA-4686) TaxID=486041 RepID=B0CSL9_LACBS|nr:uncharacterized protein LACBIDRAFT_306056 [Laccaria bicolor S238N-H82]EDR14866.1 predicted protein [Laccaria bicolor S238N-H82]|eukprot:XP_001875425.1 predicted protein [Laccaria bicolor S238N-H82]